MSSRNREEKNGQWKGNKVGLDALHQWGHRHIPKPKLCQDCRKAPPYDLANISQKYKRDITDWEWLCRLCHMIKDGRLGRFKKNRGVLDKPVLQKDLEGRVIKKWKSISEASRSLKLQNSGINRCSNKIKSYHTCGGFRWDFPLCEE